MAAEAETPMIRNKTIRIITAVYAIILSGVLFATTLLDKCLENNTYKNEARWSNGGYYLFAAVLIGSLILISRAYKNGSFSEKKYKTAVFCVFLITLFFQIQVSFWAPEITGDTDPGYVHDMAVNLANGGSFYEHNFFMDHPDNVNITILLSFLYRITGNWHAVICLGALMANLSVLMMTCVIRRLSGNTFAALVLCVTGEILMALNWRAFIPYTDNWCMPFTIGVIFLHFTGMDKHVKMILSVLLVLMGAWIKAASVIPVIAFCIYYLLKRGSLKIGKIWTGKNIITVLICLGIIAAGAYFWKYYPSELAYRQGDDARGWQYYFMVGQNNQNTGQAGADECEQMDELIRSSVSGRNARGRKYFNTAVKWILNRGFFGNIWFYTKVLDAAFDDGQFHNVQPYDHEKAARNIVYDWYCNEGKHYQDMAGIEQFFWDFFLLLLFFEIPLTVCSGNTHDKYLLFDIIFLGIAACLFVFENSSKNLFMFLPVIGCISGIMFGDLLKISDRFISVLDENRDIPVV